MTNLRAEVLALVRAAPEGLARADLRAATGASTWSMFNTLSQLRGAGLIDFARPGHVITTPERVAEMSARLAAEYRARRNAARQARKQRQRKSPASPPTEFTMPDLRLRSVFDLGGPL